MSESVMSESAMSESVMSESTMSESVMNIDNNDTTISGNYVYYCNVCDKESKQKGHHIKHLKTEQCKIRVENFKLKLSTLTKKKLLEQYNTYDIEDIIKKKTNTIKNNNTETLINKKKVHGEVIWTINEENKTQTDQYNELKQHIETVINQCHNILRDNGSITGIKAMNDIMRIFALKLLRSHFNNETSYIYKKCKELNLSDSKFKKYLSYCKDLNKIFEGGRAFKNEWRLLVNECLSKIIPIYSSEDALFNCQDEDAIKKLICTFEKIEITEEFLSVYSTACGDIHELFAKYAGGKDAKTLGSYFTPRKLINLIFNGLGIKNKINNMGNCSAFDPCMGTAGFLTRAYQLCSNTIELAGCETSLDSIKFAFCSILLTTGNIPNHLQKCDSLSKSDSMFKKYKIIITNPPFNTHQDYVIQKKRFDTTNPNPEVPFTTIYPIKTNNGACLFTQLCVYKLEQDGLCVIILPDGSLFSSERFSEFRKWLCSKVNITQIIRMPRGTFTHANVKTNAIIFTKNGTTKSIEFIETNKECSIIKKIFTIDINNIKNNEYILDYKSYVSGNLDNISFPKVKLGTLFELTRGNIPSQKTTISKDGIVLITGAKKWKKIIKKEEYSYDGNQEHLFISHGGNGDSVPIKYYNSGECCFSNLMCRMNTNTDYGDKIKLKFYYYYLLENQTFIEKYYQKGSSNSSLKLRFYTKVKKNIADPIKSEFLQMEVPLPPLEFQEKIINDMEIFEHKQKELEKEIELNKKKMKLYSIKEQL